MILLYSYHIYLETAYGDTIILPAVHNVSSQYMTTRGVDIWINAACMNTTKRHSVVCITYYVSCISYNTLILPFPEYKKPQYPLQLVRMQPRVCPLHIHLGCIEIPILMSKGYECVEVVRQRICKSSTTMQIKCFEGNREWLGSCTGTLLTRLIRYAYPICTRIL